MATARQLLDIARSDLGLTEYPKNSNNVKFNTWYYGKEVSGSAYPWCMAAVQYWCAKAGVELPLKTASCGALMRAAKEAGMWVEGDYKAGDIIIFDFPNTSYYTDHTGICESVEQYYITTIDGNTGTTNESNGGQVMRRRRLLKYVYGAVRPRFDEEVLDTIEMNLPILYKGIEHPAVKVLQAYLNSQGYDCGEVDGSFGANTDKAFRAFQSDNNLTVDGSCGKQSWTKIYGGET